MQKTLCSLIIGSLCGGLRLNFYKNWKMSLKIKFDIKRTCYQIEIDIEINKPFEKIEAWIDPDKTQCFYCNWKFYGRYDFETLFGG